MARRKRTEGTSPQKNDGGKPAETRSAQQGELQVASPEAVAPVSPPPHLTGEEITAEVHAKSRVERQLKQTFFLALAVGMTTAALGDWIGPSLAVLAYAIIGSVVTRNEENIERFADSLYYMGFLFTIWGLFFAFGPLAVRAENLSSENILTQFGIKLSTTVIALTARILIIQVRGSLAEETEEVRESLATLAQQMAREIELSLAKFRDLRDQLVRQTEESIARTQEASAQRLASLQRDLEAQTESVLKNTNEVVERLLNQLGSVNIPADVFTTRLDEAAQLVASQAARLSDEIKRSSVAISDSLTQSLEYVGQSSNKVRAAVLSMEAFDTLVARSHEVLGSIHMLSEEHQRSMQISTNLLGELAAAVAQLRHGTEAEVTMAREQIRAAIAEMSTASGSIRHDAERYNNTLVQSIRTLREEIESR